MINLTSYASIAHGRLTGSPVNVVSPPTQHKTDASLATSSRVTNSTVSTLAHQLSEAATRAEARRGQNTPHPLDSITGDTYLANKTQHDAELPKTATPELLARARQATAFVNGVDSNPFKGLARDQLSLIAHDEGGAFTTHERRAALQEMQTVAPPVASSPRSAGINGRDLMISRLFGHREPSVAQPPATFENTTQSAFEFLNRDDRALISDMYAYAQAEGADLGYVDRLAWSLGHYRHLSDGRQLLSGNNGYDSDGYRVTYNFKEEDAAIASRILKGSAINSTRFDPGYLRHILNPDYGALSNTGGMPFLEQMVIKFSGEGASLPSLGDEFATLKTVKINDNIVITTNKNIKLPPSKVLAASVNGTWSLTEEGKAAGYTLDKATGKLQRATAAADNPAPHGSTSPVPVDKAPHRTLLEALATSRNRAPMGVTGPGYLFTVMRAINP